MTTMRLLSSLALIALLAGCAASQPPTSFHTLMPALDATAVPPPGPARLAIRIAPVRVPAQVDQPQWVVRTADGGMQVLEQQRWVASPADEFREALADRLTRGLGALDLSRTGAASSGLPVWQLQVELLRFDSVAGKEAVQQLVWSLRPPGDGAPALSCSSLVREPAGEGYAALAAAHRAALMRLADAIAAAIVGGAARCPA